MFPGTFLKIVRKRVLQLFILLLPTQLGYHFWPKWAYVFGVRVDYLSPTLYLTDILAAILLVLWIHENRKRRVRLSKNNKLVILSILAFLNVVFALVSQLAILKWIKIGELYLIARILMEDAELKTGRPFRLKYCGDARNRQSLVQILFPTEHQVKLFCVFYIHPQ